MKRSNKETFEHNTLIRRGEDKQGIKERAEFRYVEE